jgi:hypothetical protein
MKEVTIFRDRGVEYTLDRARFDAHDREATRQQAIAAASRCFFAAWWLSLRGDAEGAERFLRHIPELVNVIKGGTTP